METASIRLRKRSKGLKQALIRRIAEDYRDSLSATYHCGPLRSKASQADSDLLRLKTLLERREQLRFQRTSVDLTLTIARKARNLLKPQSDSELEGGKSQRLQGSALIEGFGEVQRSQTIDRPEKEGKRLKNWYNIGKYKRKGPKWF